MEAIYSGRTDDGRHIQKERYVQKRIYERCLYIEKLADIQRKT